VPSDSDIDVPRELGGGVTDTLTLMGPGDDDTAGDYDVPGKYTIEARCGDSTAEFDLWVVRLEGIVTYGQFRNNQDPPTARKEGEDRFIFTDRVQVAFRADIDPPSTVGLRGLLDDLFKWSLEPVSGVTGDDRKPIPDYGDGVHAKGIGRRSRSLSVWIRFILNVLPNANSGFGEKKLDLDVLKLGKKEQTTVRLFYQPHDQTHPGPGHGETDNWHYYWSKEGSPGVCAYSRDPDDELFAKHADGNAAFGAYDANSDTIGIFDKAADQTSWSFEFPKTANAPQSWVRVSIETDNAPDFVNLTFAHERVHPALGQLDFSDSNISDDDSDGVPGEWEIQIPGMDPNAGDSFGRNQFSVSFGSGASRDEEFYAVLGGGFSPFGEVKESGATGADALDPNNYMVPEGIAGEAQTENDWSKIGTHWDEE